MLGFLKRKRAVSYAAEAPVGRVRFGTMYLSGPGGLNPVAFGGAGGAQAIRNRGEARQEIPGASQMLLTDWPDFL